MMRPGENYFRIYVCRCDCSFVSSVNSHAKLLIWRRKGKDESLLTTWIGHLPGTKNEATTNTEWSKNFSNRKRTANAKVNCKILTCLCRLMAHISFPQQAGEQQESKQPSYPRNDTHDERWREKVGVIFHIKKFCFYSFGETQTTTHKSEVREEEEKNEFAVIFLMEFRSQKDPNIKGYSVTILLLIPFLRFTKHCLNGTILCVKFNL